MPSRQKLHLTLACFGFLGLVLAASGIRMVLRERSVTQEARARCREQAMQAAGVVQGRLVALEAVVHGVIRDLESGKVGREGLPARLEEGLRGASESAWRLGVLYEPYALDPAVRLQGTYTEREAHGFKNAVYDPGADYTAQAWYREDLLKAGWNEPRRDHITGDLLVDYAAPFRLPKAAAPSGVVRVQVTLKDIQNLVGALAPGNSGYGFLLSAKGVFLADPLEAHVRNGDTLEAVARGMKDIGRLRLAHAVQAHRAGFAESVSGVTGQATWIFLEPVPAAGWSLGTTIIKDELRLVPADLNRALVRMTLLGTAFLLAGLALLLGLWKDGPVNPWAYPMAASLVAALGTGALWHFAYDLHQGPRSHEVEVMSIQGREAFLKRYAKLSAGLKEVPSTFIPTGLFIQQMDLTGDSQMKLSGQVWQKYPAGFPQEGRGLAFPEAVACDVGQPLVKQVGESQVLVYPFRGVFHLQADSIVNYPFDQSSVRLRILPRLNCRSVVLVPDLEAYTLLVPVSLPGIDKGLDLPGWKLGQSRFSFLQESYNTNFGLAGFAGQQDSPEMAYTFTLKRNFTNPFIATFLPLLVVAVLLFVLLVTTIRSREAHAKGGDGVGNFLRSVPSLFFPVIVSQINLRNHITTEGLLYVEYYYFVIYLLMLLTALDALAVLYWDNPVLQRDDNRIAKICFWPFLTGLFYGISVLYLW